MTARDRGAAANGKSNTARPSRQLAILGQPRPARWRQLLRVTTALTAAGGLAALAIAVPAAAQTVLPPNQSLPYTPNLSGTPGTPGNEGNPPTSGGPGTAVNIAVPAGVTWQANSAQPVIGLNTTGGDGGQGGNSNCQTCDYQNDGDGGAGGSAGSATLQIGGSPAQPTSITSQGAGAAIAIIANGGSGGTGGIPAYRGTGGQDGTAGPITFGMVAGASVTVTTAWTPAIILQSNGGDGGDGGDNTVARIDHAYGPNGAPSQSGGVIQRPVTPIGGTITSAGSGIVAISRGGVGGWGA